MKLAEHYRVKHLIEQFQVALSEEVILEKIASTNSPYINRQNLLKLIRKIQQLDRDKLLQHSTSVFDVVNAIHTLNINGGIYN